MWSAASGTTKGSSSDGSCGSEFLWVAASAATITDRKTRALAPDVLSSLDGRPTIGWFLVELNVGNFWIFVV
jgi:hypothetical protein